MTEDVIRLIEAAHRGDKEARDRLVTENVGLIWSIVRRFSGRGYEMEDLFQIGSIGLMKAIDKFDTSFAVQFSTYAVPMIQGEIKRFLRDDGMVKVSRTLKENGWRVKKAAEKLSYELGREATLAELAATTELSVEDIIMAMEANVEVESIYRTVYQGDGNEIYLLDKVISGSAGGIGQTVDSATGKEAAGGCFGAEDLEKEKLLNHLVLEQLLEELPEQDKKLIVLRYYQDKTQTEVAKELGISQVQVSRLEKKILLRMRGKM